LEKKGHASAIEHKIFSTFLCEYLLTLKNFTVPHSYTHVWIVLRNESFQKMIIFWPWRQLQVIWAFCHAS